MVDLETGSAIDQFVALFSCLIVGLGIAREGVLMGCIVQTASFSLLCFGWPVAMCVSKANAGAFDFDQLGDYYQLRQDR
jgi:hypothetical protein